MSVRRSIIMMWALLVCGPAMGCTTGAEQEVQLTSRAQSEPAQAASVEVFRREQVLMGTGFEIQVVSTNGAEAAEAIDAALMEVRRVEALLSEWQATSEISAVNDAAGQGPVRVGPELFEVVERALGLAELTGGAFDITFAGCGHLWSVRERRIPKDAEVEACLPWVGPGLVELERENSTIALQSARVRIGIGGIGKGYGVDRAAEVLLAIGVVDFVVNGGGDIRTSGRRIDRPWRVGVAHPRQPDLIIGMLDVSDAAVVTSGDWERYFEEDGVRYHHILDPRTGRVARSSMAVTVVAENATDADALATGLFVLGPTEGLAIIEALPGVEALIIDPAGRMHPSAGFMERFEPSPLFSP
ncbi:MAG: FAD:protein FMN transferase [Bradymonadaceae bacterium]